MPPIPTPVLTLSAAPRFHLFTISRSLSRSSHRHLSTTPLLKKDAPFNLRTMPSPPRLPKEDQELFESLQRQSTGAFSTPMDQRRTPPRINQSPDSSPSDVEHARDIIEERVEKIASTASPKDNGAGQGQSNVKDTFDKIIEAKGKGEELHPNVRRGAKPEFEGDVNPKTGEVGGPKNDPLRWGASSEWTYNGRATDF